MDVRRSLVGRWLARRGHLPGEEIVTANGVKVGGTWFHDSKNNPLRATPAGSLARKAASAAIARIPESLSDWIAECYWPAAAERAS